MRVKNKLFCEIVNSNMFGLNSFVMKLTYINKINYHNTKYGQCGTLENASQIISINSGLCNALLLSGEFDTNMLSASMSSCASHGLECFYDGLSLLLTKQGQRLRQKSIPLKFLETVKCLRMGQEEGTIFVESLFLTNCLASLYMIIIIDSVSTKKLKRKICIISELSAKFFNSNSKHQICVYETSSNFNNSMRIYVVQKASH